MSIKAVVNDTVVAESDATEVVEGNHYFPRKTVNEGFLRSSPTTYTCPWKGACTYYNLEVNGTVVEDGAWSYIAPLEAAAQIAGHIAFAPQVRVSTH